MGDKSPQSISIYKIFIGLAFVIVIVGAIMKISGYRGMRDMSAKYGPPENVYISGNEVMFLGLLILVITIYLAFRKRKKNTSLK